LQDLITEVKLDSDPSNVLVEFVTVYCDPHTEKL